MTNHTDISRRLALAIGWKKHQIQGGLLQPVVFVCVPATLYESAFWKPFDYRDWGVISPIAERFDCFPYKINQKSWAAYAGIGGTTYIADTPQLAIARAVIAEAGV